MEGNQKGWLSEHIVKFFEPADLCGHAFLAQVILADWHFIGKLSIIIRGAPVTASFVSLSSLRKRFSEHIFHKKSTITDHYGPFVQVLVH